MKRIAVFSVFVCLVILTPRFCPGQYPDAPNAPADVQDTRWPPLIARLAEDGMDKERMAQLFSDLSLPWSPVFMASTLQEQYGPRLGAEARVKALPDDPPLPLDYMPQAADGFEGAKALLRERASLLAEVYKRYGVPPSLIAAVLLLESDMGHELGEGLALHALASLAVTATPEQALQGIEGYERPGPALSKELAKSVRETSAWAYQELRALIRYCETSGIDMLRLPGSLRGAIGLCRFTPGNISLYGVDSGNKGVVDLFDLSDAAYSIGNFLKQNGFSEKLSIQKKLEALRRYNQSESYAALALGMSYQLAGKRVPAELSIFAGSGRKAWWPKIRPAYRLPSLGRYTVK